MVRTMKFFSVERKTFLVRFEGEPRGIWCSLTKHSKGFVFSLSFEKEEVGWLIKHLAKAIELKSYMVFNRKYREKSRVHLMEVCFNNHGRFIRLSEFASNKKSTFLVIPEGEQGKGWEQLKDAISTMPVVPSSNIVEKEGQCRVESINYKHVGPLYLSFVNVVKEEGPRRGGLVPIGRWVRAMVCECPASFVNWAKVDRALAKFLGQKGMVTIVPFSIGKCLFFVETLEEAFSLQELRFLKVKGGYTVHLRRWSPKENSEVMGKLRGGWIELRGLPFHSWSKEHLKKIVEQWGTMIEID
ncbi:hypothetical protein PVL29_017154 [Vitis rotundifolia]|uniref:DUF4283 domain-containing protein n=1 Tax=Vitis rotundifolia TaxID=103349 RepID=A0AA38Z9P8_VITRO|nr:hypothetical protein PVL29_017154 [Vitis rotundifolia]